MHKTAFKFFDASCRVLLGALVMAAILLFFIQPEYDLIRRAHPHSAWVPVLTWILSIGLYGLLLWAGFKGGRWMPIHFLNQFKACFLKHNDPVSLDVPHENKSYSGRFLQFNDHAEKKAYLHALRERELFHVKGISKCTFWLTGNKLALVDLGAGVYACVPSYCIRKV